MKHSKNMITKIFEILAKEMAKFSESELADILNGKVKIKVEIEKIPSSSKNLTASDIDYIKIKSDLNLFQSREEGLEYLNQNCRTKKELMELSKVVDIHVQRSDKIEQLKEKIIESTIGFKLRSAAIQNKSLGENQSNNANKPTQKSRSAD